MLKALFAVCGETLAERQGVGGAGDKGVRIGEAAGTTCVDSSYCVLSEVLCTLRGVDSKSARGVVLNSGHLDGGLVGGVEAKHFIREQVGIESSFGFSLCHL